MHPASADHGGDDGDLVELLGRRRDGVAVEHDEIREEAGQELATRTDRTGKGLIRMTEVQISIDGSSPPSILSTGRPARFIFSVDQPRPGMSCSFTIYDQFGQPVTFFDSAVHGREDVSGALNLSRFACELDELTLLPGRYRINAAILWNSEYQDHVEAAAYFNVEDGEFGGRPASKESGYGNMLIHHRWTTPTLMENSQ